MKVQVALILLGFVAVAMAMPTDIIDFDENNVDHEQEGVAGKAVEGKYKYVGPDGEEYFVKYVADHLGFRVVDSNALPEAVEAVETEAVETEAVEMEAVETEAVETEAVDPAEVEEEEEEDALPEAVEAVETEAVETEAVETEAVEAEAVDPAEVEEEEEEDMILLPALGLDDLLGAFGLVYSLRNDAKDFYDKVR